MLLSSPRRLLPSPRRSSSPPRNGSFPPSLRWFLDFPCAIGTELEELLGFLTSPSLQVKQAAVDIVRGLTGSDDGLASLSAHDDLALPPLMRIVCEDSPKLAALAAEALINLSQDATLSEKLVAHGTVPTAMNVLYKIGDHWR